MGARDWKCESGAGGIGLALTHYTWKGNPEDPTLPGGVAGGEWTGRRVETPSLPSADYPDASFWNRLGFGLDWEHSSTSLGNTHLAAIYFPLWLPTALFALTPALWLLRHLKRRRRARAGHCPRCGYDLRATPEKCPECGTTSAAAGVAL